MQDPAQPLTEADNRSSSVTGNKGRQKQYYTVQSLRALAALMVVMYHAVTILHDRLPGAERMDFHAGAAGVDVFFCISGFVIVMSTIDSWGRPRSWAAFIWRRISRIVPLYWLATALKLALLIAVPHLAQHSAIKPWHTLASFFFIPAWNVEHKAMPLLPQGWTLSFEMLFYGLFATALALKLKPVGWVTAAMIILSAADLARTDDWGAMSTLLNPILFEFVFGMGIALLILRGVRLPAMAAWLLVITMPILLLATNALPEDLCANFSALIAGVPAALLLLGAVSLEGKMGKKLTGLPNLLGDASYAIYLFHGFLVQPIVLCLMKLHLHGNPAIGLAVGISILATSAAGMLIHNRIEKPLLKYLQRYFPAFYRSEPVSGLSVSSAVASTSIDQDQQVEYGSIGIVPFGPLRHTPGPSSIRINSTGKTS